MRSMGRFEKNDTLPSLLTGTMTKLGMVCPTCSTFKLLATGWGRSLGHAVTNPGPVALVAVTLSTTADTPDGGTPGVPVICTVIEPKPGTGWAGVPRPERVSSTRTGPAAT